MLKFKFTGILISIILLIILISVKAETAAARYDKIWKAKKAVCEKTACSKFLPDENYNCVNDCTSPLCFAEVYAGNLLEDGLFQIRYC